MARHGAELLPALPAEIARAIGSYLSALRFERGLSLNS
ncbi:site-specific tyrosine recombinase XerD, partial [Burkholderia multivorans]